jgi:hypothetical protein
MWLGIRNAPGSARDAAEEDNEDVDTTHWGHRADAPESFSASEAQKIDEARKTAILISSLSYAPYQDRIESNSDSEYFLEPEDVVLYRGRWAIVVKSTSQWKGDHLTGNYTIVLATNNRFEDGSRYRVVQFDDVFQASTERLREFVADPAHNLDTQQYVRDFLATAQHGTPADGAAASGAAAGGAAADGGAGDAAGPANRGGDAAVGNNASELAVQISNNFASFIPAVRGLEQDLRETNQQLRNAEQRLAQGASTRADLYDRAATLIQQLTACEAALKELRDEEDAEAGVSQSGEVQQEHDSLQAQVAQLQAQLAQQEEARKFSAAVYTGNNKHLGERNAELEASNAQHVARREQNATLIEQNAIRIASLEQQLAALGYRTPVGLGSPVGNSPAPEIPDDGRRFREVSPPDLVGAGASDMNVVVSNGMSRVGARTILQGLQGPSTVRQEGSGGHAMPEAAGAAGGDHAMSDAASVVVLTVALLPDEEVRDHGVGPDAAIAGFLAVTTPANAPYVAPHTTGVMGP